MPARTRWLRYVAFLLALVAAGLLRELDGPAVAHSIIWLPCGIAVAGVWLLGMRSAWIVFATVLLQRAWIGAPPLPAALAGLGSTAEAVLGAAVLRWFGCHGALARLRDVLAVFVTAAVAPVASITFSLVSRGMLGGGPVASGYDGWWGMNALGVLTVLPVAATWSTGERPRWAPRPLLEGTALTVAIVAVLWAVMTQFPPGPTAIVLLYAVLPLLLFSGLRLGQRGATMIAAVAALFFAMASSQGTGPFQQLPLGQRYTPIQIFELTQLAIPLVFGCLIASQRASAQNWFRSEGLRAALVNVLPDVVYRIRGDGTVVDVMARDDVPLPTPREQLIGQRLEDLMSAEVASRLLAAIGEARANGRSQPVEYPTGAPERHRVREARFIRLGDDEVLGVVRDVSERAAVERVLAWQAHILELVAAAQPIGDVFTAIVRGIEEHMGRGQSSILLLRGRRLHLACAPSLPRGYSAAIEGIEIGPAVGTCGTAAHHNRTVVTADIADDPNWDIARDVAARHDLRACWSVPIRSPAGDAIGTFAIYHNQPQHPTKAETELVERAALLAGVAIEREHRETLLVSIQQHVAEGLFRCVPGQGLTYANARFATMFGYDSPEQMLRLVAARDGLLAEHLADLATLCHDRQPQHADEAQFHRRDGSRFWALVTSTLVRGLDGGAGAYVGVVADVTARKSLEEQLRQAQKMEAVGKLAGGVAHDFNNLLTAISGCAESLGESLPSDDARHAEVRGILDASQRAAGLTRQLLVFSRQQVLTPRVLDLTALVDEMTVLLQRMLGSTIELHRERPADSVLVRVDRTQMEQVIVNLVVNARDAMPGGGKLTIGVARVGETSTAPERALLWVRDTGVGMDALARSRAFDPFFTTKAPGKGTGLGLSTVYGIARQSGGDAWIDSEPGAGTSVWIRLPVTTEPADAAPTPVSRPAPAASATILLVEDEAPVRELMHRALSRAGHTVLVATDGDDALAVAHHHRGPIQLLITDVVMPGLDGHALAAKLTAERNGLPVLFVSGYTGAHGDFVGGTGSPARLLEKPFTIQSLLDAVNDLLPTVGAADANPTSTS